jgi:hypothetical protein
MNLSRQTNEDDNGRYGYASFNMNNLNTGDTNNYTSVPPSNYGGAQANNSGDGHYYSGVGNGAIPNNPYNGSNFNNFYNTHTKYDNTYSIVHTEQPVLVVDKNRSPIVIIDPLVERHVKSYLLWSIFNFFCCWGIGGIVTTFLSCKVMQLNDDKRFKEAMKYSGKVLLGNMITTGLGAFLLLVTFPFMYMAIYPSLPKINW